MKTNRLHAARRATGTLLVKRPAVKPIRALTGKAFSPANPNVPLVTKAGGIYKKAGKALSLLDATEARQIKELMAQYKVMGKSLTLPYARWAINDPGTKVSIFLHNMGIDFNDVIDELTASGYNLTSDYITDPNNWIFNKYSGGDGLLRLPDGRIAYFVFQYQGGFAIEVQGGAVHA